jgi:hypothetical protein
MTDEEVQEELSAMEPTDDDFAQSPGQKTNERYALIQAVRNLLDNKPEKQALKDLLEEEGWLPITKNTVEIEAGVNRRRFSGPLSKHPELSDLLKRLKPDRGVSKTTTALLADRGERIRILEQRLTAARSAMAAQSLRIEQLSMKLKAANARISRLEEPAESDD